MFNAAFLGNVFYTEEKNVLSEYGTERGCLLYNC